MATKIEIKDFLKNTDIVLEGKEILSAIDIDKLDKPIDEKLDMVQILHKYSSSIDFKKLLLIMLRKMAKDIQNKGEKNFSIETMEKRNRAIEFTKRYIKEDEKTILLEEGINRKKSYDNIK